MTVDSMDSGDLLSVQACETSQVAAAETFLDRFSDCVYLSNFGVVQYEDKVSLAEHRKTVMTRYTAGLLSSDSATLLPITDNSDTIVAIFDDQDVETQVRIMNILLTLFVVAIFSVGSWVFNNDAKKMIIRPIERLTALVKKLAGMVFILSADDEIGGDDGGEGGNEMDFIDVIANKMSDVLEKDKKMEKKAGGVAGMLLPDLMSRRPSSFKSGFGFGAKVKPNQRETPETPEESSKGKGAIGKGAIGDNAGLIESRFELSSLDACLSDPKARSYFRLFLSREFNVENIAFWEAVHEYQVS